MRFEITVGIDAAPETIWDLLIDIEHWPRMTASVTQAQRLDDGAFGKGSRVRVDQPKLQPAVWTVTEFEPGRSFVWESRTPGIVTTGAHIVTDDGVTLSLTQKGAAAPLLGLLYGRLIRRYVTMEAEGLKRLAES
ncbi:SRPBCC family protein [Actinomadura sp. 9N407]|uniref:SRPBCC family protein n=1 Tax=Actinomadura sp. 9N407 TaxID=3375154 RepID=UPI00379D4AFE